MAKNFFGKFPPSPELKKQMVVEKYEWIDKEGSSLPPPRDKEDIVPTTIEDINKEFEGFPELDLPPPPTSEVIPFHEPAKPHEYIKEFIEDPSPEEKRSLRKHKAKAIKEENILLPDNIGYFDIASVTEEPDDEPDGLDIPPTEEEEEIDHQIIRKRARRIAPAALTALKDILDKRSTLSKSATPAQIIRAAEIVLNYAGDRPGTAPPDESNKKTHYIITDTAILPTDD